MRGRAACLDLLRRLSLGEVEPCFGGLAGLIGCNDCVHFVARCRIPRLVIQITFPSREIVLYTPRSLPALETENVGDVVHGAHLESTVYNRATEFNCRSLIETKLEIGYLVPSHFTPYLQR